MKKIASIILALVMVLSTMVLASCGDSGSNNTTTTTAAKDATTTAAKADTTKAAETTAAATTTAVATESAFASASESETEPVSSGEEKVMSHDEYAAAELQTKVIVETYVQAKQAWWEKNGVGVGTFYTQDTDGGYFLYEMPCTKEEYDNLEKGTLIRVTGYKSEWHGEVEIIDATFEIIEGMTYEFNALDVTELLGTEDLIKHQNEFVSFKGMKVEPSTDGDGNEAAFLYNWDGSGSEGNDLYFKVSCGDSGAVYSFVVESYLCGPDTEVYKAVKELKVGDIIDLEGFLYWYDDLNPHITSVTAAAK